MAFHPVPTAPHSVDWSTSSQSFYRRMDAVVRQKPELKEAVMFHRALLPILHSAEAEVQAFPLDVEAARRKFQNGLPILVNEELPLDIDTHYGVFMQLCQLIENSPESGQPFKPFAHTGPGKLAGRSNPNPSDREAFKGEPVGKAAGQIRHAVENGELDLVAVWQAMAGCRWPEMAPLAARLNLDLDLLRTLGELSLIPALHVWAQQAVGQVDLDRWCRGMCPLCGSPPIFSEIQGKEGSRRLRCSMCGADWFYPRFQCVCCGNEDYRTIDVLRAEGEEQKYFLQTCSICHGYIKQVITFEPTPFELLAVEDLATLHLDLIAGERGYRSIPVATLL